MPSLTNILKSVTGGLVGAAAGYTLIPANNPHAGPATGFALGLSIEWVMNHPNYAVRSAGQVWMTLGSLSLLAYRFNIPFAIMPIVAYAHAIDTPTGQDLFNRAWKAMGGTGVAQENLFPKDKQGQTKPDEFNRHLINGTCSLIGAGLGGALIEANNPYAGPIIGSIVGRGAGDLTHWIMNQPNYYARVTAQVLVTSASLSLMALRYNTPLAIPVMTALILGYAVSTPQAQKGLNWAWQALGGKGVAQENLAPEYVSENKKTI